MSREMMQASTQWGARPNEERFWTVAEMLQATREVRRNSIEKMSMPGLLKMGTTEDGKLAVVNLETGKHAIPTPHARKQLARLCNMGGAAEVFDQMPVELASQNYQWGLTNRAEKEHRTKLLLCGVEDDIVLRAFTGEGYARIWHDDIVEQCSILVDHNGWRVPPARPCNTDASRVRKATEQDIIDYGNDGFGGLSVRVGDEIGPAGLYFGPSTPELFVFLVLVDQNKTLEVPGGRALNRFVMLSNSEVGDRSFTVTGGMFDAVCGNHIIWGAQDVWEVKLRHVGQAVERAAEALEVKVFEYQEKDLSEDMERVEKARTFLLGEDKETVVDAVFKKLRLAGKNVIAQGYERAEQVGVYGPANSAWGLASGMQEIAQEQGSIYKQQEINEAAGRVLAASF